MANTQTWTGISRTTFEAIAAKAASESGLAFTGFAGATGKNGFGVGWQYDPIAQTLTLTLLKHPFLVPAGMAMAKLQQLVASCQPAAVTPPLDFHNVKLGRRSVTHLPQKKLMGHTLMGLLPPPPRICDNRRGLTQWGMMGNDVLGDCTCAGVAHSLQVATLNTNVESSAPDAVVEAAYQKYCGYVPGDPASDQGGDESVVLAGIETDGFNGHRLLGTVTVDPHNLDHMTQAIASFGSIYIGAELPLSARSQHVWDADATAAGQPGTWGGHCIVSAAYDLEAGKMPWITWGVNQDATIAWALKYVDEVHVLLWDSWVAKFPGDTQEQILDLLQGLNEAA